MDNRPNTFLRLVRAHGCDRASRERDALGLDDDTPLTPENTGMVFDPENPNFVFKVDCVQETPAESINRPADGACDPVISDTPPGRGDELRAELEGLEHLQAFAIRTLCGDLVWTPARAAALQLLLECERKVDAAQRELAYVDATW